MVSRPTKPTMATSLLALLVLSSGISARTLDHRLQCLQGDNSHIAAVAPCGDKGSIAYCLGTLQPTVSDALLQQQLETCFLNAGCSEVESELEAIRTLEQCDPIDADLRKRQGGKATETETEAEATTAKPATTAKGGPKTTLVAATTEQPTTEKAATTAEKTTNTAKAITPTTTTTSPSTISTQSSTPSTSSSPSTTTTQSTSPSTVTPGPGLAHSGRPLVCFTTSLSSTTSCPVQSTGSAAGHRLPCFPTTVPTSVCAAGLICQQDANGNASCMYAYTKFDTAGVVIAIFFAVAVTGAIALVATLCCREKRAHKRAVAAQIAAEARLLASKGGMRVGVQEVREEEGRGLMGEGPFGDQHRVR